MALRIDRLATLHVVDPILRHTSAGKGAISILMYHSIAVEDEAGVHPYYRTATAPAVFGAQMQSLYDAGFSVTGIGDAVGRFKQPETARRSVVITFDDGFRNFYTNAFPVLNRFGFTATMFLPTGHIGEGRLDFKGRECLNWNEVRELHEHGISFGSHTVNHPQLRDCDDRTIREEVVVSKQTIEQALGSAVQSFSYPYAFPETEHDFKARLRQELCQAGYENGVCTSVGRPGPSSDPFFLKRLPVNSDDDPALFRAKLAGAYDWMAKPQLLAKMVKGHASRLCGQLSSQNARSVSRK
jgi:peptidoglycan/xylan/chitin deacetylase (PgdA/CDA1 family)